MVYSCNMFHLYFVSLPFLILILEMFKRVDFGKLDALTDMAKRYPRSKLKLP